jgi:F-type H+-transporting ATPase subunit epsilon
LGLQLTIVTPERRVFDAEVDDVVLPGAEGDFGVLERHERFLAPLRIGKAKIQQGGRVHWAAVSGGFAEVTGDRVVVLADACELAPEIDAARAQAARDRAERRLREARERSEDALQLQLDEAALLRALLRLEVASQC